MATETPRKIGPTGHWGEYGWRPHPAGGSEVWLLTTGVTLMDGLTLPQAEQIAGLLETAYIDGHGAGWHNAIAAMRAKIDEAFPVKP
jgi:hypothetical protein